jgi:hypothetical protein
MDMTGGGWNRESRREIKLTMRLSVHQRLWMWNIPVFCRLMTECHGNISKNQYNPRI